MTGSTLIAVTERSTIEFGPFNKGGQTGIGGPNPPSGWLERNYSGGSRIAVACRVTLPGLVRRLLSLTATETVDGYRRRSDRATRSGPDRATCPGPDRLRVVARSAGWLWRPTRGDGRLGNCGVVTTVAERRDFVGRSVFRTKTLREKNGEG